MGFEGQGRQRHGLEARSTRPQGTSVAMAGQRRAGKRPAGIIPMSGAVSEGGQERGLSTG